MPSAIVTALAVSTRARLRNDCAYAFAWVDTTPTILVASPSASRAAMSPQIPEPHPIGTNTVSSSGAARKNSSA